eukprot:scaffold1607_cov417-Prasinococcus_capsulatus_cf.AAC.10
MMMMILEDHHEDDDDALSVLSRHAHVSARGASDNLSRCTGRRAGAPQPGGQASRPSTAAPLLASWAAHRQAARRQAVPQPRGLGGARSAQRAVRTDTVGGSRQGTSVPAVGSSVQACYWRKGPTEARGRWRRRCG